MRFGFGRVRGGREGREGGFRRQRKKKTDKAEIHSTVFEYNHVLISRVACTSRTRREDINTSGRSRDFMFIIDPRVRLPIDR